MAEAAVQGRIRKEIRSHWRGAWTFHPVGSPYQESGVPDLLVSVQGLLVGIEIKHRKPGETARRARSRTTPGQRAQLRAILRSGGYAGTVLSPEEALGLIHRGLREAGAMCYTCGT